MLRPIFDWLLSDFLNRRYINKYMVVEAVCTRRPDMWLGRPVVILRGSDHDDICMFAPPRADQSHRLTPEQGQLLSLKLKQLLMMDQWNQSFGHLLVLCTAYAR